MVRKQKGGAKLIHPEKTGFSATFDMLKSEGSSLEILTFSSLYGFMFELIVDPSKTEYYTLDATGRLKTPITEFILKLVVTTPITITLPEYNGVKKASETPGNFLNEAKTQQSIWLNSISGGRPEICPAVANLSLFDNAQSHILIYWLFFIIGKNGINRPNEVTDVLHYLLYILTKPPCGIGVILMPKIMNSTTFTNFTRSSPSPREDEILEAISNILAQVVRLFIGNGIIHTDLHKSNVLVYRSAQKMKSEIIDFGRVIHVDDMPPNVKTDKANIIDNLFAITQAIDKQTFIENVMDYIQSLIETKIASPKNAQMSWLINFAKHNQQVYLQSFDILKEYYIVSVDKPTRMMQTTISSYTSRGNFYDLNRTLSEFYVSLPNLKDPEFTFASKTAVSTSSMQTVASAPQPAAQKATQDGRTKRSWTDNAQNEPDRPLGRARVDNNTNSTIVDVDDANRTIVHDVDHESTIIDDRHYGGKKYRRKQSRRKQSSRPYIVQRKQTRKRGKQRPRSKRI
jgi:hypothetical protein